jgi:hypothetical protein
MGMALKVDRAVIVLTCIWVVHVLNPGRDIELSRPMYFIISLHPCMQMHWAHIHFFHIHLYLLLANHNTTQCYNI